MICTSINSRNGYLLTYKLYNKLGESALSKAEFIDYVINPKSKVMRVELALEGVEKNYSYYTFESKYRNMKPHTILNVYCLKECFKPELDKNDIHKIKMDIVKRELGLVINKGTAKNLEKMVPVEDLNNYSTESPKSIIGRLFLLLIFGIADILSTYFLLLGIIAPNGF